MTTPLIAPPSLALLRAVREELGAHLPEPYRPLLLLLGVPDYLTCITVVLGERAVGRMLLPMEKLEPTTRILQGLGLVVRRGWIDFMPKVSGVEGTDHDRDAVPRGTAGASHGMLYIAQSEELAEGAELVERQGEHGLLAQLFGYPDCCSSVFTQPSSKHHDKLPDTYVDTGPFPREMNPCLPYLYGLHLLFHFPCSPRCEPSRELLRQRMAHLRRYSASFADYERLGTGLVLYGPQVGIALATRSRRVAEDTWELEEIVTHSERSRQALSGAGSPLRLRIHSVHDFELGPTRIEDLRGFVAWFE